MLNTLRSQVFSVDGRDAFEISLLNDDGLNIFRVTGSLPDKVLYQVEFNFNEFIGDGLTNQARVFSALRMYSQQLLRIPGIERYFFDDYVLDADGNLLNELYVNSEIELMAFQELKPLYITSQSHYWPATYLKYLHLQATDGYLKDVHCTHVSREDFEKRLTTEEQVSDYLEFYNQVNFISVESNGHEPSFIAAIIQNQPIMAFLKYSAPVIPLTLPSARSGFAE